MPWYERQLNKYGVEVRLNTPVNDSLVDEIKPNVIVVATGSTPQVNLGFVDDLANIEQIEVVMVDELVEEEKLTGENILIIGGDQIGFQLADFLAEKGKRVSVAERTEKFATKMAQTDLLHLENNMKGKDITRYAQVRKIEILPTDDIWIVQDEERQHIPNIDTIVFADDRRPNKAVADIASNKGIQCHIIGDANGVAGEGQGTIMAAVAAGYDVGRQL